MATYAPWLNPTQHPYLADNSRPSLKRKHSFYTSASSEVPSTSPTDYSPSSDASDLPAFADSADTTIDASQGSFRPRNKRRRFESTGVEGDFNELVLDQSFNSALFESERDSRRESSAERRERFWEMDGEVEVDMLSSEAPSPSSVLRPSSFHSPEELGSNSAPLYNGGSSWYEPEKDRIVITSLDSDSDVDKNSPVPNALTLENGALVSNAVVNALKGGPAVESGFGSGSGFGLFDARRFNDLTMLERLTAGMIGASSTSNTPVDNTDEDMVDVTASTVVGDDMAMEVEEL